MVKYNSEEQLSLALLLMDLFIRMQMAGTAGQLMQILPLPLLVTPTNAPANTKLSCIVLLGFCPAHTVSSTYRPPFLCYPSI